MHAVALYPYEQEIYKGLCCKLKAGFFKDLFGGNVSDFDQTSLRSVPSLSPAPVSTVKSPAHCSFLRHTHDVSHVPCAVSIRTRKKHNSNASISVGMITVWSKLWVGSSTKSMTPSLVFPVYQRGSIIDELAILISVFYMQIGLFWPDIYGPVQVGLIYKNYHIFINYHIFKYDVCKLHFEMLYMTRIIKKGI